MRNVCAYFKMQYGVRTLETLLHFFFVKKVIGGFYFGKSDILKDADTFLQQTNGFYFDKRDFPEHPGHFSQL